MGECGLWLPKALRAWFVCRTWFEDTRFECGLRLPKALRAWFESRTRFEDTQFECGEPNQPRDNVTPIHTLWTIVARGSRTLGSNVGSLTIQEIMSHLYIHFGQLS